MKVLGHSNCVKIVNTNEDFYSNLRELEGKLHRKDPNRTITKDYLFAVTADNSTFIVVKSSVAAEEEAVVDLALKSKVKSKI